MNLLEAVRARPHDLELRQLLADHWLTTGETARGRFVAEQLAGRDGLAILARHERAWLGPYYRHRRRFTWRHGFPEVFRLPVGPLPPPPAWLWVKTVDLRDLLLSDALDLPFHTVTGATQVRRWKDVDLPDHWDHLQWRLDRCRHPERALTWSYPASFRTLGLDQLKAFVPSARRFDTIEVTRRGGQRLARLETLLACADTVVVRNDAPWVRTLRDRTLAVRLTEGPPARLGEVQRALLGLQQFADEVEVRWGHGTLPTEAQVHLARTLWQRALGDRLSVFDGPLKQV